VENDGRIDKLEDDFGKLKDQLDGLLALLEAEGMVLKMVFKALGGKDDE
jgi:hypothetical protein